MERYNKMTADDAAEAMLAILDDEEKKIEKKAEKIVAERLEDERQKAKREENQKNQVKLFTNLASENISFLSMDNILRNTFEDCPIQSISDGRVTLIRKSKKQK